MAADVQEERPGPAELHHEDGEQAGVDPGQLILDPLIANPTSQASSYRALGDYAHLVHHWMHNR